MENSLENKLQRVENTITSIKGNLDLSPNAPIEEVVTATELKIQRFLNIFIQEDEPETKDGIWLQTTPRNVEHLCVDEDIIKEGELEGEEKYPVPAYYWKHCHEHNGFIWYWVGAQIHKCDKNFNVLEKIDVPNTYGDVTFKYKNCLYNFQQNKYDWWEFNLDTLQLRAMPKMLVAYYDFYMNFGILNDKLYTFYGNSGNNNIRDSVFDFKTETWSQLTVGGRVRGAKYGLKAPAPVIDGKLLLLNCTHNTSSDQRTGVLYDPINGVSQTETSYLNKFTGGSIGGMIIHQGKIYRIIGNILWVHDLETGDNISKITLPESRDYLNLMFEQIFASTPNKRPYALAKDTSKFQSQSLVITQGKYKSTQYRTAMYQLPEFLQGKMLWSIHDVAYYDTDDFVSVPTYYGDGTQWIRFKN